MRLTKIEWRNFASYGNKIQNLSFDDRNMLRQDLEGKMNGMDY